MPEASATKNATTESLPLPFAASSPLFCAAVLFASGVLLAQAFYLRPAWLLAALFVLAVVSWVSILRAPRTAWISLIALWVILGFWSAQTTPQPAQSPDIHALNDGLLRTLEGTVIAAEPLHREEEAEEPVDQDSTSSNLPTSSQTFDMQVARAESITDTADLLLALPASSAQRIRVTAAWRRNLATTLHCGDQIRIVMQMHPPAVYHDPGVWNRELYLATQSVSASGSVRADLPDRLQVVNRVGERSVACLLNQWRETVATRIEHLPEQMRFLPAWLRVQPEDAAMLTAMLTGDRRLLDRHLRSGFERTGSFHLVVVSGLHLAILAALLLTLCERMHASRILATGITIFCTLLVALATGFFVPVQRSFWMIALYLLGRIFYRQRSPLNLIGFAALCILAEQPGSILNASLQMTLLAVISIAGIALPLLEDTVQPFLRATHRLSDPTLDKACIPAQLQFRTQMRWLAQRFVPLVSSRRSEVIVGSTARFILRIVELVWTSLIVEVALVLPMAIYFHRFTLYALPTNLIVLPLLSILLPLAMLTLGTLLLWSPLALLPAACTALLLHLAHGAIEFFARQHWANLRLPSPALLSSLLVVLILLAAVYLASQTGSALRFSALPVLLLILPVVLWPRPIVAPPDALLFQAIDVGQGDSLLLITPDRHTVLVDGGGLLSYGHSDPGQQDAQPSFEIGEDVVSSVLWSRGIRRLDAVVLTHAHADHLGGLSAVVRNFRPRELWVGANPPVPAYLALLRDASLQGTRVRQLHRGDDLHLDRVDFQVLAPAPDYAPGTQPQNDDSLVLRAAFGATSVLLEGDAEAPEEDSMMDQAPLQSTVLKVGHHGSKTSTQPAFLDAVSPQWAVISCGLHNHFGHPRPEVLAALQAAHVRTFRTDLDGTTCFLLNGSTVTAMPMCMPKTILSAAPSPHRLPE